MLELRFISEMDDDELVDLHMLEMRDPGSFWGHEVASAHMTEEKKKFEDTFQQMNEHFDTERHVVGRVTSPQIGKVARLFVLGGIQPQTMVSDENTMVTEMQPTDTWDDSARVFIKKQLAGYKRLQAQILWNDHEHACVYIRLFVTKPDGSVFCANDVFVEKDYATVTAEGSNFMTKPPGNASNGYTSDSSHNAAVRKSSTSPQTVSSSQDGKHQYVTSPVTSRATSDTEQRTSQLKHNTSPQTKNTLNEHEIVRPRTKPFVENGAVNSLHSSGEEGKSSPSPSNKGSMNKQTQVKKGRGEMLRKYLEGSSSSASEDKKPGLATNTIAPRGRGTMLLNSKQSSIKSASEPDALMGATGGKENNADKMPKLEKATDQFSSEEDGSRRRRSIHFSEIEDIFSPSKGNLSDPSPNAKPRKSILKRSPSQISCEDSFSFEEEPRYPALEASSKPERRPFCDDVNSVFTPRGEIDGSQ